MAVSVATRDDRVPCEEAFDFAMARIPGQAMEATCRSYGVMDRSYKLTFRMPQTELDSWIDASFPDRQSPSPVTASYNPCGANLCVEVRRDPLAPTTKGAYDITLTAHHDRDGTTLVSIDATDY